MTNEKEIPKIDSVVIDGIEYVKMKDVKELLDNVQELNQKLQGEIAICKQSQIAYANELVLFFQWYCDYRMIAENPSAIVEAWKEDRHKYSSQDTGGIH
jgi:hypothetical protein